MHRPVWKFRYPYEAHAMVHHRLFGFNDSYHLQDGVDHHKITMAWWNGAAIILIGMLPFDLVAYFVWQHVGGREAIALLSACYGISTLYYGTYEYLHWCMHLPKERFFETWSVFRRINGHHLLHHRYPQCNLNVVLPFADWILGTLITKARNAFPQARGPAVPNVQP